MSDADFTIEIDGRSVSAQRGEMIIQVADREGFSIPRFCYHEKLSIAANCRMCLVEVERAPKPLPACATPVMDGMKISTGSDYARQAQRSVMEFLLINHPLDCPICDQGGECELQDLAVGYGEGISRFSERKRVVKDKNIGPLIATDMTRCIHCTRCIRFGDEIGGMPELGATGRGENMEIGTYIEKSIQSELSGNVIDVCPVGALTSKPFRFQARSWEMQARESIATHDAVGSNVFVHVARRRVLRVVPRRNDAVNEAWISDRDRFSYEALYADDRLTQPMVKVDGEWLAVDWERALEVAATGLKAIADGPGADQLGALASPNATSEEHYLLQKMLRGMGCNNLDHRLRDGDFRDQAVTPWVGLGVAIEDVAKQGAIFTIGCNARAEAPMLNHRVRQAAKAGANVHLLSARSNEQNFTAASQTSLSPAQWVDALKAVVKAAGDGDDLAQVEVQPWHQAIADDLNAANASLTLLGAQAQSHPQASALRYWSSRLAVACAGAAGVLPQGSNAIGAALAGMLPHSGPGAAQVDAGLNVTQMLATPRKGYVLFGVEPELDCLDGPQANAALTQAEFVMSFSAFTSDALREHADVMLPIALFAETDGTFVNAEGLWQSATAAVSAPGEARPAWKILRVLANLLDIPGFDFMRIDSVSQELRAVAFEGVVAGLGQAGRQQPEQNGHDAAVWAVPEVPIYSTDAAVRRAPSLQLTPLAAQPLLRINSGEAKRAGIYNAQRVRVSLNGRSAALDLAIDDTVADGCVNYPAALAATAALGAGFAPAELSVAEEGAAS
jgi:NADH-quinone oxidoreductase subunit G